MIGDSSEIHTSGKDEFTGLINTASGLVTSNNQLRQSLSSQKPLLEAAMLRNALFGAINKPDELQYLFSTLNVKPNNQKFVVILADFSVKDNSSQPELIKYPILLSALVREYIEKNFLFPTYCLDVDRFLK